MHRPIAEALDQYPRETLTRRPTPLDYFPHLVHRFSRRKRRNVNPSEDGLASFF